MIIEKKGFLISWTFEKITIFGTKMVLYRDLNNNFALGLMYKGELIAIQMPSKTRKK